jgi:hypothetical protein
LIEDRVDASFADQFESFLGLSIKDEFPVALRACVFANAGQRAAF